MKALPLVRRQFAHSASADEIYCGIINFSLKWTEMNACMRCNTKPSHGMSEHGVRYSEEIRAATEWIICTAHSWVNEFAFSAVPFADRSIALVGFRWDSGSLNIDRTTHLSRDWWEQGISERNAWFGKWINKCILEGFSSIARCQQILTKSRQVQRN